MAPIRLIDCWLRSQAKGLLVVEAMAMIALIGYIDWATTTEITMSVCYAAPILVFAWYGDRTFSLFLAVFATFAWWLVNRTTNPFHSSFGYWVATVNRLAYYVFFAVGGSALKARQDADRARIEAMERTRELEREIVRVSEFEQQRIGQDLHDGLCQYLAAISCAAASLAEDLRSRSQPEANDAQEIESLLSNAVSQARDLARGIFPVQMDGAGLAVALHELAATTNRLTSIPVKCEETGEVNVKDASTAMQLYRIAQEALSNALRHGHAKHVLIRLHQDDRKIRLSVEDDGSGFASDAGTANGMGLSTMKYRAHALQSDLQMGASPLGGISVSCTTHLRLPQSSDSS